MAFVRGIHRRPVNSPHKLPVTRKMFPFDDVIMQWNSARTRASYIHLVQIVASDQFRVAIIWVGLCGVSGNVLSVSIIKRTRCYQWAYVVARLLRFTLGQFIFYLDYNAEVNIIIIPPSTLRMNNVFIFTLLKNPGAGIIYMRSLYIIKNIEIISTFRCIIKKVELILTFCFHITPRNV